MTDLNLLDTYIDGPQIWDAAVIVPRVFELEREGLIEPCPGRPGAHRLTRAGHEKTDLKQGDLVTHWSARGEVGYIAEIEEDRHSWNDPVYHVVWPHLLGSASEIAIPYRRYHSLRRFQIPDSSNPA
jgi:hypothetical protein